MREARHGGPVDTLVVGDIGGDDLQEIIGVTRHEVAREDLGHLARRGLELVELVFLLPSSEISTKTAPGRGALGRVVRGTR